MRSSSRTRLVLMAVLLSVSPFNGRVSAAPRARECDLVALAFYFDNYTFTDVFNPHTLQRRPITDKDLAQLHTIVEDRRKGHGRGYRSPLDPVSPAGRFLAANHSVFDRWTGRTIVPLNSDFSFSLGWADNHRLIVFNVLDALATESGHMAVWDLGPEPIPFDESEERIGLLSPVLDGDVVRLSPATQIVYLRGAAHLLVGSQTSSPYLVPVRDPRRVEAFSGSGDVAIANHRLVQLGEKPGTSRAVLREFDPDGEIERVVFPHAYVPHPGTPWMISGPDEPVVVVPAEDYMSGEYVDLDTRKITPISFGPRPVGDINGIGLVHSFFARFDSHSLFLTRPGFKKLVPFTDVLHAVASVGPPCKQRL